MTVARHFGSGLTESLPYLWENTIGPLRAVVTENQSVGMLMEGQLESPRLFISSGDKHANVVSC